MQAIKVKYLGPTNTLGARLKATAEAGSITLPRRSEFNTDTDCARVAYELAKKFKWGGRWVMGTLPGPDYIDVFVIDPCVASNDDNLRIDHFHGTWSKDGDAKSWRDDNA